MIVFSAIYVHSEWLYGHDASGRVWRTRHDPWEWHLMPPPDKPKPLHRQTEYERLLDLQRALRKGECPDGLEPSGPECPRCGERRTLKHAAWCHVEKEEQDDG